MLNHFPHYLPLLLFVFIRCFSAYHHVLTAKSRLIEVSDEFSRRLAVVQPEEVLQFWGRHSHSGESLSELAVNKENILS